MISTKILNNLPEMKPSGIFALFVFLSSFKIRVKSDNLSISIIFNENLLLPLKLTETVIFSSTFPVFIIQFTREKHADFKDSNDCLLFINELKTFFFRSQTLNQNDEVC